MSHRHEQLEAELRRQIGQVLAAGLADPRIKGLITVTEVSVTQDRQTAVVSVSIMPEEAAKTTLQGLYRAARHVQTEVSRRLRVRQMPVLQFKLDKKMKKQVEVQRAIEEAVAESGPAPEQDVSPTPPDDRPSPQEESRR